MSKRDGWKDMFQRQAAYGRRWKEIFRDNHDSTLFLERSDAVTIIKRAQLDVYDEIIEDFKGSEIFKIHLDYLQRKRESLALSDISALGMRGLDIEALRQKANEIFDNLTPTEMDEWIQEYRRKNDKKTP